MRAVTERLSQYSYIYFGDNARAPYGTRPSAQIINYTWEGVNYLFEQGAMLVILACNTASAVALRYIQQNKLAEFPAKNVLGIVVPTIEQILGGPHHRVGLLATPSTVASGAYDKEIHKRAADIKVFSQACAGLVEMIETGVSESELKARLQSCLDKLGEQCPLEELDALLLGCTHYALIANTIKQMIPESVNLLQQPNIVAESLFNYLERHKDLAARLDKASQRRFLTSGDPVAISGAASKFYGEEMKFEQKKPHREG